jgi:hypothetical protein
MIKNKVCSILILVIFTSILIPVNIFAQAESQVKYQVKEELNVKVSMRDGIRLSTNIYRPDAPGKFPVILVRTPYGNGGEGHKDGHFFAQQGFVVVDQDCRGRYESEGEFYAMKFEAEDGYDMQQWVGQQSWCNGKIGTSGGSYVGFTQWMPAPLQSPYLKTMFAAVTFSDFYETLYQNGAFRLGLFGSWSIEMTPPNLINNDFINKRMDSVMMTLPIIEMDKAMGWRIPFLRDWFSHPVRDSYWEKTSVGDNYSKINASVYNVGGWYDILLGSTIENYLKMTAENIAPEIRKKQKLLIGPWEHNWGNQKVGELDFGKEASFNSRELRLRWFNSQLKGEDNEIINKPPVKIFVMGENKWRYENEWPLARTNYTKYYFHSEGRANTLSGNGTLETRKPNNEPVDKFVYDPSDPVVSEKEIIPYDQTTIEKRGDVLVYTSSPLKNDLEVTGPVEVQLFASSTAKNTDFTAKLVDVYPDGRAMRICEGIIRASYRSSNEKPTNIEPGKIYEYTIDLWATSNLFKAGHQIRVEISSSNFPRFDRNLNTGNNPATDTTKIIAKQIIYHDENYPSCIVLPIIEKTDSN